MQNCGITLKKVAGSKSHNTRAPVAADLFWKPWHWYTAKNAEPAVQQDWTMFCCPYCSHLSTILNNIVEPESGVTILFNIVDNYEQCGQQSIVQSCFHQCCNNLSVFTRVAMTYDIIISIFKKPVWKQKQARPRTRVCWTLSRLWQRPHYIRRRAYHPLQLTLSQWRCPLSENKA
jgi:hypothetical protein